MADTYYTSRYSGEDIDNAVDKVNDTSAGNDALKAALDALTARCRGIGGQEHMIYFNNWELTADCEVLARQHDNLTRSITVTGDLSPDWTWENVCVSRWEHGYPADAAG